MPLRVCCCYDGSEHSKIAVEHLKWTLRATDEVELLCCVKASKDGAKEDKRRNEMLKKVDAEMAHWEVRGEGVRMEVGTAVPRANVKIHLLPAKDFRAAIVEHVEGVFDMVVLGARGLSTLQRMVTGSVSTYVLNTCRKTPVYIVNKRVYAEHASYLIAADGSPASDSAVEFVARLLREKDVVHIVACYETTNLPAGGSHESVAERMLQERKQKAALTVKLAAELLQNVTGALDERLTASVLEVTKVEEGLVEYAEARGIFSCIVMGSRGRSSMVRMCLGSTSNYVLHHNVCPVLVMHTPKEHEKEHESPQI